MHGLTRQLMRGKLELFCALAEQTGVAVNTVKNIAHDLIEELSQTVRYEIPVILGIDEVNLADGYRYIITNLATNNIFVWAAHSGAVEAGRKW